MVVVDEQAVKVLVATDGSNDAVAAATAAIRHLAGVETVIVVSVIEATVSDTYVAGLDGGLSTAASGPDDRATNQGTVAANELFERTIATFPTHVDVERVIAHGDAGRALCRLAAERNVDFTVVGRQGHGRVRRALLGSVSSHVVNNAPCPVMVVRHGTVSSDE
jgi:nucleotide-binding universal stress UspA family protein